MAVVGDIVETENTFIVGDNVIAKNVMPGAFIVNAEPPSENTAGWDYRDGAFIARQSPPAPQIDPTLYQRQRVTEYPPMTDYIDGVVKGDQAQIDAYIAACLAVKAKYPKPE